MIIALILILNSFNLHVRATIYSYDSQCGWIDQVDHSKQLELTDLEERLLDECILHNSTNFYLRSKFRENSSAIPAETLESDWENLIQRPPPGPLEIVIIKCKITWLHLDENSRTLSLNGFFHLGWQESRIQWSLEQFLGVEHIRLYELGMVPSFWVPLFGPSNNPETMKRIGTNHEEDKWHALAPTLAYDGFVALSTDFSLRTPVDFSYESYPYDEQFFCAHIALQNGPSKRKSKTTGPKLRFHFADKSTQLTSEQLYPFDHNWQLVMSAIGPSPKEKTDIQICFEFRRKSRAARVQFTIPLMCSTILAILAPLFGGFQLQAVIKVVSMMMQYLCLQNFMDHTKSLPFGDALPRLLVYYEFVLITTMVTLIQTLTLWCCSQLTIKAPVQHRLTLIASLVNSAFCCTRFGESGSSIKYENTADSIPVAANDTASRKNEDWFNLTLAINNVLFIVFMVIYIVGMCVLLV